MKWKEYIEQWVYEKTFFLHQHFPWFFSSIDKVTVFHVFYKDGFYSVRDNAFDYCSDDFHEMTDEVELYYYRKKIREEIKRVLKDE